MNRISKIVALVFMVSLSIGTASAQFYLGARGGLNMSNMSWNTASVENLSIMGFHGGVTSKYQFSKRLSVQMDALASTMGNRQKLVNTTDGVSVTTETTTNIFYAQVPVYINYEKPIMPDNLVPYRVKKSSMSFHLFAGGYFGYGLAASSGSKTTTVTDAGTEVTEVPSGTLLGASYNPIDFGAMAGLGMSFKLDEDDTKRLGLDARYLLGFSDFDPTSEGSATNSAIQVSLMFTKKLTKRRYTNRHAW
ncbi:MAG: PorT family protein [Bacteroidia bacterium]|nr:PorT family protein [Bacteroidia bacterium]